MWRALASLLVALFCLALSPPVRADDDRFRDLVAQATAAFGRGDFEQAIQLAKQAYEITPDARLLYNIARAHETLGKLAEAIDYYRRYLDADPNGAHRDVAKGRILALETTIGERLRLEGERFEARGRRGEAIAAYRQYLKARPKAADRPEIEYRIRELEKPAAVERDHPAPARENPWPWVTIGAGVVVIGVGGVFAVLSRNRYDEAKAAPGAEGAVDLAEQGDRYTDYANVGFVAGGLLVAGGLAWRLLVPSKRESKSVAIGVGPRRVSISGRF